MPVCGFAGNDGSTPEVAFPHFGTFRRQPSAGATLFACIGSAEYACIYTTQYACGAASKEEIMPKPN
jgi:hypothetical protein